MRRDSHILKDNVGYRRKICSNGTMEENVIVLFYVVESHELEEAYITNPYMASYVNFNTDLSCNTCLLIGNIHFCLLK